MLLEAATAVALVAIRPEGVSALLAWTGLVLLALVWVSTATLQAPHHRTLALGFDPASHCFLVASNWLRTAAWSARGLVAIGLAAQATTSDPRRKHLASSNKKWYI